MPLLGGGVAGFYVFDEKSRQLRRAGAYGLAVDAQSAATFGLGEGLVGQCARDGRPVTLTNLPPDYLRIASGVGAAAPAQVLASPLLSKDTLLGVVETATFHPLDSRESALLGELMPLVAMSLEVLQRSLRTQELLGQTQEQARQLGEQTDQLHISEQRTRLILDSTDEGMYGMSPDGAHHLRQRRGVPDAGLHDGGNDRTTGPPADPPPSCGWERVSGGGMSDAHRVPRG